MTQRTGYEGVTARIAARVRNPVTKPLGISLRVLPPHVANALAAEIVQAEIRPLVEALESLRRQHLVVDDCWYSCPKSGECCNDMWVDRCLCGADAHNARIEAALDRIQRQEG
jgi:hypothetical protein